MADICNCDDWGCGTCYSDVPKLNKTIEIKNDVIKTLKNNDELKNNDILNELKNINNLINKLILLYTNDTQKNTNDTQKNINDTEKNTESEWIKIAKKEQIKKYKDKILQCMGKNCNIEMIFSPEEQQKLNNKYPAKCDECNNGEKIKCRNCNYVFYFSNEQKNIYKEKEWNNPKTCKFCKVNTI